MKKTVETHAGQFGFVVVVVVVAGTFRHDVSVCVFDYTYVGCLSLVI